MADQNELRVSGQVKVSYHESGATIRKLELVSKKVGCSMPDLIRLGTQVVIESYDHGVFNPKSGAEMVIEGPPVASIGFSSRPSFCHRIDLRGMLRRLRNPF